VFKVKYKSHALIFLLNMSRRLLLLFLQPYFEMPHDIYKHDREKGNYLYKSVRVTTVAAEKH
jgi:hypothetical protein